MTIILCIKYAVKMYGKMWRDAWYNAQAKYYYQDVIDKHNNKIIPFGSGAELPVVKSKVEGQKIMFNACRIGKPLTQEALIMDIVLNDTPKPINIVKPRGHFISTYLKQKYLGIK